MRYVRNHKDTKAQRKAGLSLCLCVFVVSNVSHSIRNAAVRFRNSPRGMWIVVLVAAVEVEPVPATQIRRSETAPCEFASIVNLRFYVCTLYGLILRRVK